MKTLLQTIAVFKPHLTEKTMKKAIQALLASALLASTAIAASSWTGVKPHPAK